MMKDHRFEHLLPALAGHKQSGQGPSGDGYPCGLPANPEGNAGPFIDHYSWAGFILVE